MNNRQELTEPDCSDLTHGMFREKDEFLSEFQIRLVNLLNSPRKVRVERNGKWKRVVSTKIPVEEFVLSYHSDYVMVNKLAMVKKWMNITVRPKNKDDEEIWGWVFTNEHIPVEQTGYQRISHSHLGISINVSLHALVYKTFMKHTEEFRGEKLFIDHIAAGAESRKDNKLCSLRLVPASFNNQNRWMKATSLYRTEIDFTGLYELEVNRLWFDTRNGYFISHDNFIYNRHYQFNKAGDFATITVKGDTFDLGKYGCETDKEDSIKFHSEQEALREAKGLKSNARTKPYEDETEIIKYLDIYEGYLEEDFIVLLSAHNIIIKRGDMFKFYRHLVRLYNKNRRIHRTAIAVKGEKTKYFHWIFKAGNTELIYRRIE